MLNDLIKLCFAGYRLSSAVGNRYQCFDRLGNSIKSGSTLRETIQNAIKERKNDTR